MAILRALIQASGAVNLRGYIEDAEAGGGTVVSGAVPFTDIEVVFEDDRYIVTMPETSFSVEIMDQENAAILAENIQVAIADIEESIQVIK